MLNVQDEVLANKPMYRIRDEQGNIIEENAEIELNTPVVQEGTAMNKLLFDKVNNEILLDGRYNKITQEGNRRFGNLFDGTFAVEDGWYTNGKVRVKCDVENNKGVVSQWNISNCLNGTNTRFSSTINMMSIASSNSSQYYNKFSYIVDFGTPVKPIGFNVSVCIGDTFFSLNTTNVNLEVSNDGENWTTISTITIKEKKDLNPIKAVEFDNYYRYFRVYKDANTFYNDAEARISLGTLITKEVLLQASSDDDNYKFLLDTNINEYDDSRKINIEIPEDSKFDSEKVYLRIGNLPYKKVNGFGKAGGKLTLIYNEGTDSFDIDRGELEFKRIINTYKEELYGSSSSGKTENITLDSFEVPANIQYCDILFKLDGYTYIYQANSSFNSKGLTRFNKQLNVAFALEGSTITSLNSDSEIVFSYKDEGYSNTARVGGLSIIMKLSWNSGNLVITPIIRLFAGDEYYLDDAVAYGTLSTTIIPIG